MMTIVSLVRGTIIVVTLREDKDVVTATERVLEDGGRAQIDVGIATRCLVVEEPSKSQMRRSPMSVTFLLTVCASLGRSKLMYQYGFVAAEDFN